MKREIKFRAWGKYGNNPHKMHYDDDITPLGDSENAMPGEVIRIVQENYGWIFMQYTGLKDRHGVEIYEGDVLRELARVYLKSDGTTDKRYKCRAWDRLVVEWGEYSADDIDLVYGYEYNLCGEFAGWNINKKTAYEIIGNIYETPHLLEANNDI